MLSYALKRSKRKTISITVAENGEVIVSAPLRAPKTYIDNIVKDKAPWINSKLDIINKRLDEYKPKQFINGEIFEYLGNSYKLRLTNSFSETKIIDNCISLGIKKPNLNLQNGQATVRRRLLAWYRTKAQQHIDNYAHVKACEIGVKPLIVKEKAFRRSWGMCHSDGKVFINFKLIMAPVEIINYVIVHELCHLVHPNHSKHFWDLVYTHCNSFKSDRLWLKENGYKLEV